MFLVTPKMMIRQASVLDTRGINRVHVLSWKKTYRGHIPDEKLDNLPVRDWEARWRRYLRKDQNVYVLERQSLFRRQIIGFVNFGPTRDKDRDPQKVAEIYGIYLHPDYWRQGHGGALCRHVIALIRARGYPEVNLWVLEGNRRARKFYRRLGLHRTEDTQTDVAEGVPLTQVRYRLVF